MKYNNFPYLHTRRINQDCVENFFGSIRQQGGNSVNPTPIQFIRAFEKLFSMKILQHTNMQNNEFCSYIHKLEEVFVTNFESNCFQKNIGSKLFHLAQNVDFEIACSNFPKIYLLKLFMPMRIYFTLSQHNKECKSISRKNRKLLNILHL